MKIINLIEDTPGSSNCLYEHGLSFYIETKKHKILMDTGASDAFIKNATQLGIDLKQVDIVVLSHGHYDHSGGILSFVKINPNATIYIQKML
ncbi:MBL fold metallo-hydrolase [Coprobacillaceae bacterium CR2/5/TPMF4]|nr:MBL fold metallo-hydrolase [Coprobacillaceae bacterium CR2/5/TPMF4]